jgi:hypothetical protein
MPGGGGDPAAQNIAIQMEQFHMNKDYIMIKCFSVFSICAVIIVVLTSDAIAMSSQSSAKQIGSSWVLSNKIMRVEISSKTGSISAISSCGASLLTSPADILIKDVVTGTIAEDKDAAALKWSSTKNGKSITLKLSKSYGSGSTADVIYTLTDSSLRWDAAVSANSGADREVKIDFRVPLDTRLMPQVFYTTDVYATPCDYTAVAGKRLSYGTATGFFMPIMSFYSNDSTRDVLGKDVGVTLIAPFEVPKPGLDIDLASAYPGVSASFSNHHLRMGVKHPANASLIIVAHEGDYRPGLKWMLANYPDYFKASNKGWTSAGPYAMNYVANIANPENVVKLGSKGAGVAWQQEHYLMPFYGLYFPEKNPFPIAPERDNWKLEDWESDKFQAYDHILSRDMIKSVIDLAHANDIQAYLYFNNFDCWGQYADKYFAEDRAIDVNGTPVPGWSMANCRLMNPVPGSKWEEYLFSQFTRLVDYYKDADGIFNDQFGYANYDFAKDDGVSMEGSKPCYLTSFAQAETGKRMADYLHKQGKALWVNGPNRVETIQGVDGVMTEGSTPATGWLACFGLERPMIHISYPDAEAAYKACLVTGNQIQPSTEAPYTKDFYGNMFRILRQRRWFLGAHALSVPAGLAGNIFRLPDGSLVITIVDPKAKRIGSDSPSAVVQNLSVRVRVPQGDRLKYCYQLSGDWAEVTSIVPKKRGKDMYLTIPKHQVSSMLVLSNKPRDQQEPK